LKREPKFMQKRTGKRGESVQALVRFTKKEPERNQKNRTKKVKGGGNRESSEEDT